MDRNLRSCGRRISSYRRWDFSQSWPGISPFLFGGYFWRVGIHPDRHEYPKEKMGTEGRRPVETGGMEKGRLGCLIPFPLFFTLFKNRVFPCNFWGDDFSFADHATVQNVDPGNRGRPHYCVGKLLSFPWFDGNSTPQGNIGPLDLITVSRGLFGNSP